MTLQYAEPDGQTSRRHPMTRQVLAAWLFVLRVVLTLGFLLGLYLTATQFGGVTILPWVMIIGLVLLASWAVSRRGLHRRRVACVFAYCARGIDAGLPLPQFLRSSASGEQGVVARRLLATATAMESGFPVARALCESLPELDDRQAGLLIGSMSTQSTREVLDRLTREHAESVSDPSRTAAVQTAYWASLFLAVSVVSCMVMIFVLPKFDQILRDFGLQSQVSLPIRYLALVYAGLGGVSVVAVLWLVFSSMTALTKRRGSAWGGWSCPAWDPLLGRAARDRKLADLYNMVADSIECGLPVERLPLLGSGAWRRSPADQASVMISLMSSGHSIAESARLTGLPAGDVAVLATASSTTQLVPALRLLVSHRTRASTARRQVLAGIVTFVLICLSTALVGTLVYSVWTPMVMMMDHVLKFSTARMI